MTNYQGGTTMSTDPAGNISATTVRIPKGNAMPSRLEAVVMTDTFPASARPSWGTGP
ncbi:MAG: hypothetical protein ACXVHI_02515 [Frankiaceae bacterium]